MLVERSDLTEIKIIIIIIIFTLYKSEYKEREERSAKWRFHCNTSCVESIMRPT